MQAIGGWTGEPGQVKTINPGMQVIGDWASQVQASLGKSKQAILNPSYWLLGKAARGKSRQVKTRNPGMQAIGGCWARQV